MRLTGLQSPPSVKLNFSNIFVKTNIRYNLLAFNVRTDLIKVTDEMDLVPITLQIKNSELTYISKDGVQLGMANIYGRVTTMTGNVVQMFEEVVNVDVTNDLLERTKDNSSLYWKAVPLKPGIYKLDVVVKDMNGDRMGMYTHNLVVPRMDEDQGLMTSSLILADQMENVSAGSIGTGAFVIDMTKVRPKISSIEGKPVEFKRNQNVNLWMQVYNLETDKSTSLNNVNVEYLVTNTDTGDVVPVTKDNKVKYAENKDKLTLRKKLDLSGIDPGSYRVTIIVNDNISKKNIIRNESFVVE